MWVSTLPSADEASVIASRFCALAATRLGRYALAAFGRGNRDDATMQELQRLRDEAERVGLMVAISALEEALSST